MNCLDFRRAILADPRQPGEAERAHALECAACREFLARQRELDARIFAALQVPPPDGLADRMLVARGLRRRLVWPMAAALLLTGGLVSLWTKRSPADLGQEAIAHVSGEPQSFTTSHNVPNDFLAALLSDQGMNLVRAVGQVTYARICPMAGGLARHLVARNSQGPVTIFLLPDDPGARRRAVTQRDGMAAITIPATRGAIAIVASDLDRVAAVETALRTT